MRFQSINALSTPGLPPPVTSGGFQSFIDTDGTVWIAQPGVAGGQWRKATDVLAGAYHRNATFNLTSTPVVIGYDILEYDPYTLYNSGTGTLVIPLSGIWRIDHQVSVTATATGQWVGSQLNQNGVTVRNTTSHSSLAVWCSASNMLVIKCAANDQIQSLGNSAVALAGRTGVGTYFQWNYIGAGI